MNTTLPSANYDGVSKAIRCMFIIALKLMSVMANSSNTCAEKDIACIEQLFDTTLLSNKRFPVHYAFAPQWGVSSCARAEPSLISTKLHGIRLLWAFESIALERREVPRVWQLHTIKDN